MVPPSSHGVSRVPRYFGYSSLTFSFAYVTLTLFGTFSHTFQLEIINTKCCPKPHKYCYLWFSLFRFRSPLLTESRLIFSSSPYLDVSVQAVPLIYLFDSVYETFVIVVHFSSFALLFAFHYSIFKFRSLQDLSCWWAQVDSNHRPHAYQACALTT